MTSPGPTRAAAQRNNRSNCTYELNDTDVEGYRWSGMGQHSFRMIETNGITLTVVVEGDGPLLYCCTAFHSAGICGAIRSTN